MSEHKEPIPSMIYNASVGGHVTNSQQIIDENENKEQSQINAEVKQNLGQGGSVDSRIAAAVNAEKTRAEGAESTLDGKIAIEKTRAEAAEEALDGRVDTLEEAVGTGGSVDSRIAAAVVTETSRAQTEEGALQQLYENLTQSDIVVTEDHTQEASPSANIIYRELGTTSYSDWMYYNNAWKKMATYDNAIDDEPTAGSNNLVKSGGVESMRNTVHNDNYYIISNDTVKQGYYTNRVVYDQRWVYDSRKIPVSYNDVLNYTYKEDISINFSVLDKNGNRLGLIWNPTLKTCGCKITYENAKYIVASIRKIEETTMSVNDEFKISITKFNQNSELGTLNIRKQDVVKGYITNINMNLNQHDNIVTYPKVISITPNTLYNIEGASYKLRFCYFDKSMNYLALDHSQDEKNSFITPTDAYYVVFGFYKANETLIDTFENITIKENVSDKPVVICNSLSTAKANIKTDNNTIVLASGIFVYYNKTLTNISGTYSIPVSSSESVLKLAVFNTTTNQFYIKSINTQGVYDYVIGTLAYNSGKLLQSNLPFPIKLNDVITSFNNCDVPVVRTSSTKGKYVNINTVNDRIEFPSDSLVIYSGKLYPIISYVDGTQNIVPISASTSISSVRVIAFDKENKSTYCLAYNEIDYSKQYILGWFNYNPNSNPKIGGYYFDFDFTIDGKTKSNNSVDIYNELYRDYIRIQSHMFMHYIGKTSPDPIIPSQTLFEIQLCARLGIKSIEANCLGTATAGKYVVMHGGDPNYADVGYQLVLKKSVYDANPTDFPIPEGETLVPYGEDAYYYPWDNIPNTSYDRLRNSYFNRSQYPKYRVPITELTEFLKECKKYNIMPIVTYVDDAQIDLIESIVGKHYAIRDAARKSDVLHIYWDSNFPTKTKDEIISACTAIGAPMMYGVGTQAAVTRYNNGQGDLVDIIESLHKLGYYIVFDGNYYNEDLNQQLKYLNFDGQTTDWDVPLFEVGNIIDNSANINFDEFNHNGVEQNGTLTLSTGNTVTPKETTEAAFVKKALLEIVFNGTIDVTLGKAKVTDFTSDGSKSRIFTNIFMNTIPSFTITAKSNTEIYNIVYKVSKC